MLLTLLKQIKLFSAKVKSETATTIASILGPMLYLLLSQVKICTSDIISPKIKALIHKFLTWNISCKLSKI